jgi:hypothetical protein
MIGRWWRSAWGGEKEPRLRGADARQLSGTPIRYRFLPLPESPWQHGSAPSASAGRHPRQPATGIEKRDPFSVRKLSKHFPCRNGLRFIAPQQLPGELCARSPIFACSKPAVTPSPGAGSGSSITAGASSGNDFTISSTTSISTAALRYNSSALACRPVHAVDQGVAASPPDLGASAATRYACAAPTPLSRLAEPRRSATPC